MTLNIQEFYEKDTQTFSYVVWDGKTKAAAIIDSVLNYDIFSARFATISADEIIAYIKKHDLKPEWILETHIHADHITAADYLKNKFHNAKIAISENIKKVQEFWIPFFNLQSEIKADGSQFDKLFKDGEKFKIGSLDCRAINAAGHTPSCVIYQIEDSLFVGDVIFMPDIGTARTDFPGGSAEDSYNSLQKILAFADNTRIFTGHDYPTQNRTQRCQSTVGEQKEKNILINKNISKDQFIQNRTKRDVGKAVPKLLFPSIQINIRAGKLGKAEGNGNIYIKFPINKF